MLRAQVKLLHLKCKRFDDVDVLTARWDSYDLIVKASFQNEGFNSFIVENLQIAVGFFP